MEALSFYFEVVAKLFSRKVSRTGFAIDRGNWKLSQQQHYTQQAYENI